MAMMHIMMQPRITHHEIIIINVKHEHNPVSNLVSIDPNAQDLDLNACNPALNARDRDPKDLNVINLNAHDLNLNVRNLNAHDLNLNVRNLNAHDLNLNVRNLNARDLNQKNV